MNAVIWGTRLSCQPTVTFNRSTPASWARGAKAAHSSLVLEPGMKSLPQMRMEMG